MTTNETEDTPTTDAPTTATIVGHIEEEETPPPGALPPGETSRSLTIKQAAELTGKHRNTIRNWIIEGKLTSATKDTAFDGGQEWHLDEEELYRKNLVPQRREGPSSDLDQPITQQVLTDPAGFTEMFLELQTWATKVTDAESRASAAEARLEYIEGRRQALEASQEVQERLARERELEASAAKTAAQISQERAELYWSLLPKRRRKKIPRPGKSPSDSSR